MHSLTSLNQQISLDDPYEGSALVEKTRRTRRWSVLDLDGTFAAGSMAARKKVRQILEESSALIFSTARTPELVMSSRAYETSKQFGRFSRGRPRWSVEDGKHTDVPLESLSEFTDALDPDAILPMGELPCIRGMGSNAPYLVDDEYRRLYLDPEVVGQKPWLASAHDLVEKLGLKNNLSPIDRADSYAAGSVNVEHLSFRLQLDFKGSDAVQQKYDALAALENLKKEKLYLRIEGVDESKPDENRATLYLMPPNARKENMLNRALSKACRFARMPTNHAEILIAGDTLTDFYAGCYGGWDAIVTCIIVGGSRLAQCIEEKANFAGVDLRRMHHALKATSRPGWYRFDNPLMRGGYTKHGKERTIILGETAYPNTVGAETILAYLEDNLRALA